MKKIIYLTFMLMSLLLVAACTKQDDKDDKKDIELSYSNSEVNILVGDTISVKPTVKNNADDNYTLEYTLSNNIATVDNEGNLTALEVGTVKVTVTVLEDENAKAELTVNITEESVEQKYTITLDVNGGNALSSDTITFKEGDQVSLPTPSRNGFNFLGWYENNELVQTIEARNYDLVAKWEEIVVETNEITITYSLDNGVYLGTYSTRNELINELISDIQTIKGSDYTLSYLNSYVGSGYGMFASGEGMKTFFSDNAMRTKWTWLLEHMKSLREAAGLDASQYDTLISKGYVDADSATVNLEVIAFICGKEMSYTAGEVSYKSTDYSKIANSNAFFQYIHDELIKNNKFEKGVLASSILPKVIKTGEKFVGWYTSSNFEESSKVTSTTTFTTNVTLYAKFEAAASGPTTVTFDYNGGVSESLYAKYGSKLTSLVLSSYNGAFWTGTNYEKDVFISTSTGDPGAKFSSRIYIGVNSYTGLYTVISVLPSGTASSWPEGAEYVITISGQYSGTYDDNFSLSKISVGDVVVIDKTISSISSSALANANFYSQALSNDEIIETVTSDFILPSPKKIGYTFAGWYDDYNNKYESAADFEGLGQIVVYATWKYEDRIIGSYKDNSWVVVGNKIQLLAEYTSGTNGELTWESKTPEIATVDQSGFVTGVKEGVATIVVSDATYSDINFTFYVTVFNEEPTGLLGILADSNNSSIYTKEDLLIGIRLGSDGAYLSDIIGSVSKLLFTDYVVHDDYYIASPTKTTNYTSGVEFITVHYAADMPYSASASLKGGSNLASYNQRAEGASWHYSVGNDGIWSCQNENKGAWHAGASKTMTWTDSGVTTSQVGSDLYTTDVTMGKDGYFYIKGVKTTLKNTSAGTKLNGMGLGVKIVGDKVYLGGHYQNTSYNYISSTGGNNNSIGMETSVRQGSDLWLTWQYTAQLCAKLLLNYNLPLNRLVGHHFFSGKWCPQPMLEYDLEIWYEFVELTRQQMALYKDYSSSKLTFSSNSQYLNKFGRVTSLPTYSESVKYTVTYTQGSETKTVTLCSILPGSVA